MESCDVSCHVVLNSGAKTAHSLAKLSDCNALPFAYPQVGRVGVPPLDATRPSYLKSVPLTVPEGPSSGDKVDNDGDGDNDDNDDDGNDQADAPVPVDVDDGSASATNDAAAANSGEVSVCSDAAD